MEQYNSMSRYRILGVSVSVMNVSMQLHLLLQVRQHSIGAGWEVVALLAAYFVADFVSGLVHMIMDNNDRYDSFAGPLIANFHLHHKIPQYREKNLLVVYFTESGSKIWLAGYLLAVWNAAGVSGIHPVVSHILVYIGILSSVAEVSHYLCHSSLSAFAAFLGNCGLLLSKRHHAKHHLRDNCNYAFLNGAADPLLNLIAAVWFKGYKQNSDLHYALYVAADGNVR